MTHWKYAKLSGLTLIAVVVGIYIAFANFDVKKEGFSNIQLYTLKNSSGMTVKVTNYGAIITSVIVPDREGKKVDVALGYNEVQSYMNAVDKPYFGAVVGRYGNRIAGGEFSIDGKTYKLAKNNGNNHLHGGIIGLDKVVWTVDSSDSKSIVLSYNAKDMEEGYPGNLKIKVTYTLEDKENKLTVSYFATTDKTTPVNLTQHTYFNLKGEGQGDILGHELMLNAKQYTPIDIGSIPTGELPSVVGTPFDFTTAKAIGQDIEQENEQLQFGKGYDHNWVVDQTLSEETKSKEAASTSGLTLVAEVFEPTTGRVLSVHSTEPGVQFYCGNFLDGRLTGKSDRPYVHRGGFCLETQHYPDSPNQPDFPSTLLKPGEEYKSQTTFTFTARKQEADEEEGEKVAPESQEKK